jgi:hypothetical protein
MDRKTLLSATLVAALALAGSAGAVTAQDDEPGMEILTGTITTMADADGVMEYYLDVDGTLLKLSVGPPWFWGDADPLAAYVGQSVELQGFAKTGIPDDQAADIARERAVAEEAFDVRFVAGSPLWDVDAFRPPWAGGPAVVGEIHPGYAGWSRGQEAKAAGQANAEGRAGGPEVVGASHPGYTGWARGQAAKAAGPGAGAQGKGAAIAAAAREQRGRP